MKSGAELIKIATALKILRAMESPCVAAGVEIIDQSIKVISEELVAIRDASRGPQRENNGPVPKASEPFPCVPRRGRPVTVIAKRRMTEAPAGNAGDLADALVVVTSVKEMREAMKKAIAGQPNIPSAVAAIVKAGFSKNRIAKAVVVDPGAIGLAADGKVYPYVYRGFRQYLDFPPAIEGEDISDAEARLKAIHEG